MSKKICGIYKIENKKTGQIYIGQSTDIQRRFKRHCSVLPVDLAIANEGVENFDFTTIEQVSFDKLIERESYWIDYYNTLNSNHYNRCKGHNLKKYLLWDTSKCYYRVYNMLGHNRKPNPCRCFAAKYNGHVLQIGLFEDFLSCEIVNDLINKYINK